MKIALAQTNTTVGDFNGNVERIVRFARCARDRGADLVVFPELALCGYPPRDLVEKPSFIARSEAELDRLAQLRRDIRALVGYVRRSGAEQGKQASDAAALLYRGKRVLDYSKILLAFYDVFDESRYFEPGNSAGLYAIEGWQLGVTICEDAWNDKNFWKKQLYTRDPVEEAVRAGAKLLLNIASSPFTSGKIRLRHDMLKAIAIERQVPVVYVNQVGGNDQLVFDGSSMAFNARGELCARAKSFEEDLVIFDAADGLGPAREAEVRPGPASDVEAIYQALLLGLVNRLNVGGRSGTNFCFSRRPEAVCRVENHEVLFERFGARAQLASRVERHAGAVEHQLVVSAHLVDVDDGDLALDGDGFEHIVTQPDFSARKRRGRDIQQQLRAGANGFLHRVARVELLLPEVLVVPGILANRHPELPPFDFVQTRRIPRLEVARFVEHVVKGEQDLAVIEHALSPVEKRRGIRSLLSLLRP